MMINCRKYLQFWSQVRLDDNIWQIIKIEQVKISKVKEKSLQYCQSSIIKIDKNQQQMSYLCSQLARTVCPCLFSKRRNLSTYGDNQFIQRQQFIAPQSIDHQYQIKHNEQFSGKQVQSTNVSVSSLSNQGALIEQKERYLSRLQEERQEDSSVLSPVPLIVKEEIFLDYTDVISVDHPYYDILLPKLETLPSLFDVDEKYLLQHSTQPFPLKMYCKQSEVRKTNIFIYSFQFQNTTYDQYQSLLNNFELQKTFDSNINDYYKKVQSPNNDTKVIYLSYNKVLIVAPRDFVYVRYVFRKGQQLWSIATSIPNEQEEKGKIRGEILLTATKVIQTDNNIHVQVYSEVNMKMAIKPQMAKNRGKTEIKKYLEKCYNHLSLNNTESIL